MDSETLNMSIGNICDDDKYSVKGLEDSGKCIPYIGWFWRRVDFNGRIVLGNCEDLFIGFMENNKWAYEEWYTTKEQHTIIVSLLQKAIDNPSNETLQEVFDYIQTCTPETRDNAMDYYPGEEIE